MFFKLTLCTVVLSAGFLFAQGDGLPGMVGNYGDFGLVPGWEKQPNEFTFARLIYNGRIPGYGENWFTDYPKGDRTIVEIVRRLTNIDIAKEGRAIPIHHPDLFNYPMIYASEPEQMVLDHLDVLRLREYFSRGGFLMVDDFWGTEEWFQFDESMKQIFPNREIEDISLEHPIFHTVFDIHSLMQVPNICYAYRDINKICLTMWENDGVTPHVRGIFDDDRRLMVAIFFNTDTMDAAEWADDQRYPHKFSSYAYKIFINTIVYTMTH